MVVRRAGRREKRRGHRTYHGAHKKWRGGGSRGGRGKAGGHKHKWSYVVKYEPDRFGKMGFKRSFEEKLNAINLYRVEELARKENKKEIDVSVFGFEKVLGTGKVSTPLIVKAKYFSKSAIEKLEKAGGKAVRNE